MTSYGERIQAAVAAEIRAEMAAQDIRQPELAKRISINQSSVSRYLTPNDEARRDMPMYVFADIAKALGLTMRVIAERAERRLDGEQVQ